MVKHSRVARSSTSLLALSAVALTLAGCGADQQGDADASAGDVASSAVVVSPSPSPEFVPSSVEPIRPADLREVVHDEGLNADMQLKGVSSGMNGGIVIHVVIKNNNDVDIPQDAFADTYLKSFSGTQDTEGKLVDSISGEDAGIVAGIDAPIGALSTVVVDFPYSSTIGAMSNAEFKVGNIIFKGNLASV